MKNLSVNQPFAVKKNLFVKLLLLPLVLFSIGVGTVCGTTYTGTVPIITSYTNYNINGISWTVEGTATAALNQNIDGTKGAQIGTGKAPANSLSFSTSGINGTITSITINTSGAKDVKANVSVTIGGSAFGGEAKTITNSAANYTFTGSASGNVVISWSQSSSKALYVKTITIEYSVGSIKTLHFPSHKSGHSFLPNLSFSLCQCSSCNFFKCLTVALYFHCILIFILFTIYNVRLHAQKTATPFNSGITVL